MNDISSSSSISSSSIIISSATKTLKEEKEDFVTGHNGTTSKEVFLILLSAPLGMILYMTIINLWTSYAAITRKNNRHINININTINDNKRLQILLEYIFVIIPVCMCETKLLYPTIYCMIGLCMICIPYLLLLTNNKNKSYKKTTTTPASSNNNNNNKLEYISWYKSLVILYTIIAILAVDFHIFPRRFIKTEIYGHSLMDIGASSTIISSAIVSSYAKYGFISKISSSSNSSSIGILFIIGIIRTIVLLYINYQGHDSEYGIHWNFFLTLFVVNSLCSPIRRLFTTYTDNNNNRMIIQRIAPIILLSIIYQFILSYYKLHDFIIYAPRTCENHNYHHYFNNTIGLVVCNFFYSNREGIIGCIGYLILYYLSQEIAHVCIWSSTISSNPSKHNNEFTTTTTVGTKCMITSLLLWTIHLCFTSCTTIPISRRTTNMPFIIWTLSINITLLTILYYIHHYLLQLPGSKTKISYTILLSINSNNFIIFIVANLCTGIINLCINTLRVNDIVAFIIIFIYVTFLVGVALCMQYFKNNNYKEK